MLMNNYGTIMVPFICLVKKAKKSLKIVEEGNDVHMYVKKRF